MPPKTDSPLNRLDASTAFAGICIRCRKEEMSSTNLRLQPETRKAKYLKVNVLSIVNFG
jgi:hypothetical protein